jgi:hypothetical protein
MKLAGYVLPIDPRRHRYGSDHSGALAHRCRDRAGLGNISSKACPAVANCSRRTSASRRDRSARELRLRLVARARGLVVARPRLPRRDRPSFARIFHENAYNNGIAPIIVEAKHIDALMAAEHLNIDLMEETIGFPDGSQLNFTLDPLRKQFLLEGGYMEFMAKRVPQVRTWLAARAV